MLHMEKYITHYNYLQMLYSRDKPQNYNNGKIALLVQIETLL